MKGGFAMLSLAIDALRRVAPDAIGGPLRFLSVIEEECTGNGTLASCLAGQLADAVVLAEPTGPRPAPRRAWGSCGSRSRSPARRRTRSRRTRPSIRSTKRSRSSERSARWSETMNDDVDDPALEGEDHPYNINIGAIRAGDWASSVPAIARLDVRIGHPTAWTPDEAEEHGAIRDRWTPPATIAGSSSTRRRSARRGSAPRGIRSPRTIRSRWRSPMPMRRRTANAPTRSGWEARPTLATT